MKIEKFCTHFSNDNDMRQGRFQIVGGEGGFIYDYGAFSQRGEITIT